MCMRLILGWLGLMIYSLFLFFYESCCPSMIVDFLISSQLSLLAKVVLEMGNKNCPKKKKLSMTDLTLYCSRVIDSSLDA